MNTLSINSSRPLVTRFAWKEYRMLRGLWVASFLIGLFLQILPYVLTSSTMRTYPEGGFLVAWIAAALYSVGAAITMFCAETEERTRDYLRLLPGNATPIIATKLVMAFATAVALGCVLSLTSWFLANYTWANSRHAELAFALGGVGILEGLAWGLLFSLWWKQPLLAAVAAMACASLGAQVAILGTTDAYDAFSLEGYRAAVPGRLLICLAVLILDSVLASQWLYPRRKHERVSHRAMTIDLPASNTHARVHTAAWPRTKMFTRLLWQTWRESWKMMLAAIAISAVLMTALMLPAYISSPRDFLKSLPFVALIPPALLGALAFRADQQRDHRLFLATHAAKPRYVWLARHVVWFGVVLLLGIVIHLAGSWLMQNVLHNEVKNYFEGRWSYHTEWLGREFSTGDPKLAQAWRFEYMQSTYVRGVIAAWTAFIAAYGVGQLCSMLLKQSLLSGFLAILFAVILAVWSVLMYLWEMNSLWFILPIGSAALLATWLRTPNWILGKNHWRHWIVPALALFAPLAVMLGMVPAGRMMQLEVSKQTAQSKVLTHGKSWLEKPFAAEEFGYQSHKNEFSQTALAYERLAAEIDDHEERFLLGPNSHLATTFEHLQVLARKLTVLIDQKDCVFPAEHVLRGSRSGRYLQILHQLLLQDAIQLRARGLLDVAFERLCANLRLLGYKLRYQTSSQFAHELQANDSGSFTQTFAAILEWAQAPDQTSERLKAAIPTLEKFFKQLPPLTSVVYADRERVRQIILEIQPPSNQLNQLPTILNRLPGEQARALQALDISAALTREYIFQTQRLINATENSIGNVEAATQLRNDLRSAPWTGMFAIHPIMDDLHPEGYRGANQLAEACATSFLVAEEFRRSGDLRHLLQVYTNFETNRRALLVQLALLAYRIDHGQYPDELAALVPDYLPQMINDPYSGKPFAYHPGGLDLPLVLGRYNDANAPPPEIPAETPLFWSVGVENYKLMEFAHFPGDLGDDVNVTAGVYGGEGISPAPIVEQPHLMVYKFQTQEGYGSANSLVFPLPKIDDVEETKTKDPNAP